MAERRIAKKHIQRLQQMLTALDYAEARLQARYGDREPGTVRNSNWRDAESLRAVLAVIAPPAPQGQADQGEGRLSKEQG